MESIVITWRELLIVVFLILSVYAAEVLFLTRSGRGVGVRKNDEGRDRELQALETEISGLYLRLDKLQGEVDQLKNGQRGTVDARSYGDAMKMAGEGADVDKLAANCGISRAEAELIVAVNRLSHQKPSP